MDCVSCQVRAPSRRLVEYQPDRKCCEFSPFVSAFAMGALLQSQVDVEALVLEAQGQLVLTQLGVIHSHRHRKQQGALCHFFDKEKRQCSIWSQRPAICFSFFCTQRESKIFSTLESDLLNQETELLQHWYFESGGTHSAWDQWGLAMEEHPLVDLPEAMLVKEWEQASQIYQEASEWLRAHSLRDS